MLEQASLPVNTDTPSQVMTPAAPSGLQISTADQSPPDLEGFQEAEQIMNRGDKPMKLDIPDVDFSAFDAMKEGREVQLKQEAKEKKEENAEVKEVLPESKQEEVKETPVITLPQKPGSRNYLGLDDSEKAIFKKMNNDAYNKLYPVYIQSKDYSKIIQAKDQEIQTIRKNSTELPSSYLIHPEAFTLSPEYRNTKAVYDAASFESRHWEQQLANIESGREWQDLNIDQKTGQYVTSDPMGVDNSNRGQVKALLMGYMTQARLAINDQHNKLSKFVTGYQERNRGLINTVQQKEQEFFPAYKDPNFKGWKPANEFLSNLPQELKEGNPITSIAAKLYATVVLLQEQVVDLQNQQKKRIEIKEDQRKAGPTVSSFSSGGIVKAQPTMDDFAKLHDY
jgi:hypothetical protein